MNSQNCLLSVIGTNLTCYSDKNSACQSVGRDVWKLIEIDCKCQLLDDILGPQSVAFGYVAVIAGDFQEAAPQVLISLSFSYFALIESSLVICCL